MNIADSLYKEYESVRAVGEMDIYKEYEAVRAVEEMDNVEVMMFVDASSISSRETLVSMTDYQIEAINLIMKGKK